MNRFFRLGLIGFTSLVFTLFYSQLLGQASIVNNGVFPRHETVNQRTIVVRFDQAVTGGPALPIGDWVVRIGLTAVTVNSATRFNTTDIAIVFQPSDVNGASQNFLLPGQVLTFRFTNSGTLTTVAGGAPANNSVGFVTSINNWTADCSDVAFLAQGLITLPLPAKTVDICSPVVEDFTQYQFYLSLRVRNSVSYNAPGGGFFNTIDWGDGSAPTNDKAYTSDTNGVGSSTFFEPAASGIGGPAVVMATRPTHNYPATLPGTGGDCSWNATITPSLGFGGFISCTGLTQQTIFKTYDTDNKNTGILNLPPSPLPTSRLVCRGTNVGMRFSDATNLNCRSAVESTVPNQQARAIRFTYGSTNFGVVGNIPDVRVTLPAAIYGAQPSIQITNNNATGTLIFPLGYFPTNTGPSDGNGVITLLSPVTVSTLLTYSSLIFTIDPTKQVVGQRFYVKMEYWDVCNPYDPFNAATLADAESIENYVEIVAKPVPLTTTGLAICYTNPNSTAFNFAASSSIGGTRSGVNWYKDVASVGTATMMTNPGGTNTLNFPAGSYGAQGGIGGNFTSNNTNGRYHSVWATQVASGSNSCESDPVEIVIVQQPRIDIGADIPSTPSGSTSVCNGPPGTLTLYTTSVPNIKIIPITFSTNAAAINLPTENIWSVSGFGATVTLAPSGTTNIDVTYNISPQPTPLDNGSVSVRRGYVTTTNIPVVSPLPSPFTLPNYNINPLACLNPNVNLSVDVYGQSNGGTITPSPTICAGITTGNMNATGTLGAILQWERSFNAGAFVAIAATAGLTTFSEIPPNGAGTYKYRVLVQNLNAGGPCASATTIVANQNTVTVNPTPPQPTISQTGASTGLTICADGVQRTILQSSDVGALAASYQWFRNAVAVVGATSSTITLTTVAQSGSYTVQVIGVPPSNCPSPISNPIVVAINPLPTAPNPTGGGAVCSGNPAPDIVWSGLTGTAPFTVSYSITKNPGAIVTPVGPIAEPTTTFTVVAPNPVGIAGDTFDYKITSLVDANGCSATNASLLALSSRQVSIGGTAPAFDTAPTLTPASVCDNGASTTDPQLNFSLDVPSTALGSYTLTYKIDALANQTRAFTVNLGNGDPSAAITFTEAALNTVGPHTVRVVSILTPSGCLTTFNIDLPFTVNPLPANPTGAINGIICSTSPTGFTLGVADPGVGFSIEWYTNVGGTIAAVGTNSGVRNQNFTPTSNATATYFALTRNTATLCRSTNTLPVTNTLDTAPAAAVAGPAQPNVCASTANVVMAATAANNGGNGAWSIAGQVAYFQNFANFSNGTNSSTAINGWTRNVSGVNVFTGATGSFDVQTNRFVATNTNGSLGTGVGNIGEVIWNSSIIDISAIASATATVDLINVTNNLLGPEDYIRVFFKLNGGAEVAFPTNGNQLGNFVNTTASAAGLSGATLQIVVRVSNDAAANSIAFDNVVVRSVAAAGISFNDSNSATATITGLAAPAPGAAPISTTLTWTVSSALGVCPNTTSNVVVTINPLPTITDPAPKLCETLPGGNSTTGVDLTSFNAAVTNAPTVAWFSNSIRTISVPVPTNVTVLGPTQKFYFTATSGAPFLCSNNGEITFTVNPQPSVATPSLASRQFCEDVLGGGQAAGLNLPTLFNTTVTGGAANRSVTWFDNAMVALPTPAAYTLVGSQTLFATVTNTLTSPFCTRTVQVDLSIKPRPIANPISGNASVCTGNNIILYQLDPSFNPGSTYTWSIVGTPPAAVQVFGGGGTNTANFFALLKFPAATGSVKIDVFETLNGCTGVTSTLTVNVNTAPSPNTITGIAQVCSNQTGVQYSITSPNVTSTYTWTVTGATVASAANDKINVDFSTISPVAISVSETSTSGCVGTPANLSVTVNPRPVMTSGNSATVCSGSVPVLNFTSSIAGSTFDWAVTGITGAIGGSLVGDTGTGNLSQSLVNNSGVVGSVTYSVTPTASTAPFCDGPSQSVTITVNPAVVLVNPQTKTICGGSQVNYEIVTSPLNLPSGTTFTWPAPTMSAGAAQGTGGTNIPAGTPGTLHITDILTNTSNASITATYNITPTSGLGCPGTLRTVVITVNPQPVVNTGLNSASCSGDNIGLTLNTALGSTPASNYNITSRSFPGSLTPAGSNALVPATGVPANYLANDNYKNLGTVPQNVTYTVVPVSGFGCIGAPLVITISITPEPSLSASLDLSICSGLPTGLILNTAVGSIAAVSYNVVGVTVAPGLVPSGTNAVVPVVGVSANYLSGDRFSNTTNGNLTVVYQVVPVGAGSCAGDPPKSVTITVRPEPVISTTLNATVCSRSAIGLALNTLASSVAAADYNIISRTIDAGLVSSGTNAAVPMNGVPAGYLLSDAFTNTTNSTLTVTYRVAATSSAGCTGAFKDILITINPEPVLSSSLNLATCSDVSSGLVLNTNGTSVIATSYNITARSISGGLVANVGNVAVPASGVVANYLSNDIFTNTGASSLTVTYTVVPVSSAGCLGASRVVTLTINPEPVMATNLDGGVCSDVAIGIILNTNGSSVAAADYDITALTIAPGLIANAGNVTVPASGVSASYISSDIFQNTGTTPLNVTYTVLPNSGASCAGNPRVITLIVNPEPIMSNSLDATVCSSISTGLTLNTNGTSVSASNYNITIRNIAGGLVASGANVAVPATGVAANYLANDKFANTTSSVLTVTYTVVPISATGCPGPAKLITISINPEPVLSASLDASICSDVAIGLTLNTNGTSVPASTFNITSRTVSGGLTPAGTNASVPANGVISNYLTNDVFTNTGTLPLNVTYTIVPISGAGCIGAARLVTMTINPEPVVSTLLNATVCSDASIGLALSTNGTSVAAANYNITNRTIAAGLTPNVTNAVVPATGVATGYLSNDKFTNTGLVPLLVTYTVVPVSGALCVGKPQVITITINPEPVVSSLLNSTSCSDASIGLLINTNGTSVAALNYNITARAISVGLVAAGANALVPATAVSTNYLANDRFNNVTAGSLTVTYTVVPVAAGGCLGDPLNIVVTISPEPVLSPTLNKSICSDLATALVLNTNGTSTAAPNYNITSITTAGGLTAAGTNSAIPASGVNANFLANDKFTNTGPSDLTVVYRIVPISAASCLGDPVDVTVTINPEPVVSTALDATVCSGLVSGINLNTNGTSVAAANYNITARTIAAGLTPAGTNVAVPASGVATGYLNGDRFTNVGPNPLAVTYTVVPVSGATCVGKARVITLTVNPEPVVSPSLNATICSDLATGLTLATNGTSVAASTYNVTVRSIAVGLVASGTNAAVPANNVLANYLNNDKFTNNGAVPLNVTYTVIPTSGAFCNGQPVVITIQINPEPVISNGLDKTICSDAATALSMSTVGTSVAAASYNFTSRAMAVGLVAAGGNVAVPSSGVAANYVGGDVFTNTTNSALNVTYTIVPVSGAGCVGDSKIVIVTINPEPVVSTTLDAAVCSDLATGLALNTNGVSVPAQNYNVTARNIAPGLTANGSNAIVPALSVAPNYLTSDKFTNPGILPLTVTYTVVPVSSAGCLGDPKIITLTIGPKPIGANDVATICSDATVFYNLQNNVNTLGNSFASNFSWVAASNGSVTGESTSVQSGPIITDALNNITNADQIVVYTATPTGSNGCPGSSFTISVTVRPEPVGKDDSSSANSDVIVNYNLQNNVNTLGNNLPANFSWVAASNGNVGGESTTPQSNPLINDILNNVTNANQIIVYTVTPTGTNGCLGNPFTITVTVLPEPVGVNDAVTINSSNGTTSIPVNYNLQNNVNSVGNGVPSTFSWVAAPNPLVTGQSTTSQSSGTITDALQNSTGVDQVVVYTVTPTGTNGVVGNPFTITVTIRSRPVGVNDAKTVCSDIVVGYSLQNNLNTLGNGQTATFSWFAAANPTVTGESTTPQSTATINDALNNVTNADQFVIYTVTPTGSNGVVGNTFQITITVQPEPVVSTTLDGIKCSSVAYGTLLNTNGVSIGAASYDVTVVSKDVGITGGRPLGLIGAGSSPANIMSTDSYTNTTATPLKVTYSVLPRGTNGCVGDLKTIVFTINPEPVMSPSLDNTVCSDNVSNIILGTNGTSTVAASYELVSLVVPPTVTANAGNIAVGTIGSLNMIRNDLFTNTTASSAVVVYGIRGISNSSCSGQVQLINLTISPKPVLDPLLNPTPVCSGVISNVTLGVAAGSIAATSYNINSITFAPLTRGPSNSITGTNQPANAILNDTYINTDPSGSPLPVVYKIAPVSAAGCIGAEGTVTLTINPAPALSSGLGGIVCSNSASGITFSTTGAVTAANYNIISVTIDPSLTQTAGNTGVRLGVAANEIVNDRFQNLTNGVLNVTYRVEPVSAAGCKGPQVDILLRVEPSVTILPISNATICSFTTSNPVTTNISLNSNTLPSAGAITFNVNATSPGNVISVLRDRNNLPATSALPPVVLPIQDQLVNNTNAAVTVTYTITPVASGSAGGAGCLGTPTIVTVLVQPKPKLVITPSTQEVCSGVATTMTLSTPTTPTASIQFTKISFLETGGMTSANAGTNLNYSNGQPIGDVWQNPTTAIQTVTYTFSTQGAGCFGDDVTVLLKVKPTPTVTSSVANVNICSLGLVDVKLEPDLTSPDLSTSTIINYVVSAPPQITGARNGVGDILQTLRYVSPNPTVANSDSPVTVTYTVTPTANGCSGSPITVQAVVNPTPKLLSIPNKINVCHTNLATPNLNIALASNVVGTLYKWTIDPTPPIGVTGAVQQLAAAPISGISQVLTNTTGSLVTLTYTITAIGPGATQCEGDQKIVIVNVAPEISASFTNLPLFMCKNRGSDILIVEINGQAPFSFVYNKNDGVTNTNIPVTNAGNFKVIPIGNLPATTTYTLVSVQDAFGCPVLITAAPTVVKVGDVDATFVLTTPPLACDPSMAIFNFNQVAEASPGEGPFYTWQWRDGTADITDQTFATTVTGQTIQHSFSNFSPTTIKAFNANLFVQLNPSIYPFNGCSKTTTQTVSVYPFITAVFDPDVTEICSGGTVTTINQSQGVTSHRWFWRKVGSVSEENDVQTGNNATFTIVNNGPLNPQPIEIVYDANNGNCPAPRVFSQPILVYQSLTPNFTKSAGPYILNSNSALVTFTNACTPFDPANFSYDWTFGNVGDVTPVTFSQTTTAPFPPVDYSTSGLKRVTLKVTNIAAPLALSCSIEYFEDILIIKIPPTASFEINPVESCSPTIIKLSNVVGTGLRHEWVVRNITTGLTFVTEVPNPEEFKIFTAGEYSITYRSYDPPPGGSSSPLAQKTFKVYDRPFAIFTLRPDVVFVPDTEMVTYNDSQGANKYEWDFEDGTTSEETDPKHTYLLEGKYKVTLIAKFDHGNGVVCRDTLVQQITARQGGQAKIPNAFSPNTSGPSGGRPGNGTFNDVFLPLVKGIPNDSDAFNLQIYDRWGNLIFESTNSQTGWDGYNKDGRLMPAGVYVYKLTLRFSDSQRTTQVGDVTMIH